VFLTFDEFRATKITGIPSIKIISPNYFKDNPTPLAPLTFFFILSQFTPKKKRQPALPRIAFGF
jgi:hypothetical protein